MSKFKVGDIVICPKYFNNYDDIIPMDLEDVEKEFEEIYEWIVGKTPLTIIDIKKEELESEISSPYVCKDEDGNCHELIEKEISLTKINNWRKRICSDNIQ